MRMVRAAQVAESGSATVRTEYVSPYGAGGVNGSTESGGRRGGPDWPEHDAFQQNARLTRDG